MSTPLITDPLQYAKPPLQDPTAAPRQTLGKQDFLNLLMVKLRNQDPLNVQQDTDFIAQMAQFSNLEQTTNLNVAMENLAGFQRLTQGAALIGKEVDALIPGTGDQPAENITGVVDETRLVDGQIQLIVAGKTVDFKNILSIRDAQGGN